MNCNVIKDLIPLYIDHCCSKESATIVEEHMASCSSCRKYHSDMNAICETQTAYSVPTHMRRIDSWKASILQSLMLIASFAMITIGVAMEAKTPSGPLNGNWANALIIPATGLLISLTNWYFVRLYRSRKTFSICSVLWTLGCTLCGYIWSVFHYPTVLTFDTALGILLSYGIGILLTTLFCGLSKILSNQYAKMIGKE